MNIFYFIFSRFRKLKSKKGFLLFNFYLSIFLITFSLISIILSDSLSQGYKNEILSKLNALNSDFKIIKKNSSSINLDEYKSIEQSLLLIKEDIIYTPYIEKPAIIFVDNQNYKQREGSYVFGIDEFFLLNNDNINKYLTNISPCLKYALAAELITKLPVINWKKVNDEGKPRFFNSDEIVQIKKVFQECHWTWMADIFTVAINTGMRRGELSKIGSKVNLVEIDDANFLSIPKEESKTKKARLVPLNEDALAAVKRLGDVSKFWRNKSWNKAWIYARNKVSPGDKNFTGHVTRHTTATMFADAGMNLKHIGKFLGHASERTTMKYIKTSNEQLVKMSSLLQGVA